jgi:LPS-assembly protein
MRLLAAMAVVAVAMVSASGLAAQPPPGPEQPSTPAVAGSDEEAQRQAVERITFEVPFTDEAGGGIATGTAGSLEYLARDLVVASEAVEFRYRTLRLQAETVTVDLAAKKIVAEGNVILDEGPRRLAGERLEFDLEAETGVIYEGKAFVDPDIYFTGAEIAKVGDGVYTVRDGTVTACSEDKVPDWSFNLGKARVNLDGFARVHNTTMRVKKMPVLYSPFMLFPAKRGRQSGFLFPNFGHSSSRGTNFSLAYFQTLGDSYDTTLFAELYGDSYYGLGNEFRYQPSATTGGAAQLYFIDDPIEDKVRWKASWYHVSDKLPFNMRGRVSYRDFSDFDFFRDFERSFYDISIRSLYSTAFASGNWGSHSLNILVDERETFIRSGVVINQRQLPEIEYRLRPRQIGSLPLYVELLSSANLFQIERTNVLDASYGRVDLLPTLRVPLSYVPWLSATVGASGRATWYGESLTPDRQNFSGESLTRFFPAATAEVIGPSFSRIFEKGAGSFGKFKHIIEPRFTYGYVGDFDDQELVPLFDEVDTLRAGSAVGVAFVNRLLAKPADESLGLGAREILSFELSQLFSLEDDQPFQTSRDRSITSKSSPIGALLRFQPGPGLSLELRSQYSTLFDEFSQASLLGSFRKGGHALSVSWVAQLDPELGTTRSHQARVGTDLTLVRNRLRMQNQVYYDLRLGLAQQHRHILYYTSQCYGLRLEFRELNSSIRQERDIRLAVSLKNIGTFLDIGHGDDSEF